MGIVNVTPDSFSDGGRLGDAQAAIRHALKLQEAGADILDVGGESTRPGAAAVSADEEIRRVLPVIETLADHGCVVSVDTMKPEVMCAALDAGAAMVNDVTALRAPGALEAVAACEAAVCLMHMQGDPQRMQQAPSYTDVVQEVKQFLQGRVGACEAAGISRATRPTTAMPSANTQSVTTPPVAAPTTAARLPAGRRSPAKGVGLRVRLPGAGVPRA